MKTNSAQLDIIKNPATVRHTPWSMAQTSKSSLTPESFLGSAPASRQVRLHSQVRLNGHHCHRRQFIESTEEVSAPDAGPTNTGPWTIVRCSGLGETRTSVS